MPPPDKDGVRIAELDEMSYRRQLWTHTPLTDFWRVGKGYAKKLNAHGLKTMGDIARFAHEAAHPIRENGKDLYGVHTAGCFIALKKRVSHEAIFFRATPHWRI